MRYLIIISLLLSGCSYNSAYYQRDIDGNMVKVQEIISNHKTQITVETPKGYKMTTDPREPNLWRQNIVPIFQGAMEKSEMVSVL